MVDSAEWLAISLGAAALGIAVWDNIRDQVFYGRKSGPVRVKLEKFDIPQSNVLVHNVRVGPSFKEVAGTQIRIEWSFWNHVSWPVYVTLGFERSGPLEVEYWTKFWDERLVETESQFFLPPHQPVRRTLWITWPRGADCRITPMTMVGGKKWRTKRWVSKEVRWKDGRPELVG